MIFVSKMKSFKKSLKLLGLILLIVLASFGIGIGGGVPIPSSNKKDEAINIKLEADESEYNKTDLITLDSKQ